MRENGLRVRIKSENIGETTLDYPVCSTQMILENNPREWEMNARFPVKKNSFYLCVIIFIKNDPLIYSYWTLYKGSFSLVMVKICNQESRVNFKEKYSLNVLFLKENKIFTRVKFPLEFIHKLLWHSKSYEKEFCFFLKDFARKYLWLRLKFVRNASCWLKGTTPNVLNINFN